MRSLSTLFFTLRVLFLSALFYNLSRFLPEDVRSQVRQKSTLRGANKIANFFLRKGGIFLKAAQYLSTISNLFDTQFTEVFSGIPDRIGVRPYKDIRKRFYGEFQAEPEELLLEFDRRPLASASLGQVHLGKLHDGSKVAIKLLYPKMESQVRHDLRALRYAVRLIRFIYPSMDFRPHRSEFSNMIAREIDYRNEAKNIRRARNAWGPKAKVFIPRVIDEFSRPRVLTTEYVEGIHINDIESIKKNNIDTRKLVDILISAYVKMIFGHRFFHADPHPGNIFVIPPKEEQPLKIALIDFGATQDVSERTIEELRSFIATTRDRDIGALVSLVQRMGILEAHSNLEKYTNLIEIIYSRYASFKVKDYYRINPIRLGRVIKMYDLSTVELRLRELIHDLRMPRRFIYLGRTFSLLLSISRELDENLNIFMIAKPYIDRHLRLPSYFLTLLRKRVWYFLEQTPVKSSAIPGPILEELNKDKSSGPQLYYRLGQQLLFAFLGLSGLGLTLYLKQQSLYQNQSSMEEYAYYSAYGALLSFMLLLYRSFFPHSKL